MTTPTQARQLADECWTTGAQVEAEALRSLASQVERLEAERDSFKTLLLRYRHETPIGNQPHMIAHEVDNELAKYRSRP